MLRGAQRLGLAAVLAAVLVAGCAKAQARVAPVPPALQVPEPPPKIITAAEPDQVTELPEPPPVAGPPPVSAPAARASRPASPPGGKEREEPPRPDTQTKTEETVRPPGDPPRLSTPQTLDDQAAERRIRDVLQRASRTLSGVSRAALTTDARGQYDTARRFIEQAEEAMKVRNYVFATYLAEKARTLADGLVRR